MPSDPNRGVDTYLTTGVATDIASSQLKEMDDFHKQRLSQAVNEGPVKPPVADGIERTIEGLYFSIPRVFFLGLALLGALIGFLSSAFGFVSLAETSAFVTAGVGAVVGYAFIPAVYIVIRLGYWALKIALGFAFIYLIWRFLIQPLMEGRSIF
ncbi:MAG: hypothetical protein AAFR73_08120 [Pseudomonadota bacterium]